jgi:hypothetical protein
VLTCQIAAAAVLRLQVTACHGGRRTRTTGICSSTSQGVFEQFAICVARLQHRQAW